MNDRIKRINELLKKEISKIILREVDLSEYLVTVTRADASPNLQEAKIYISVMPARIGYAKGVAGGPADRSNEIFSFLNRNIYNIQQQLNSRLNMRPVPKIIFKKEEKTEQAAKIEEILEDIKKEENKG